jgi:hypothetical protein
MNDEEAKRRLEANLCEDWATCECCAVTRHALQAIEDRAVLIRWHYDTEIEITEATLDEMAEAHHAARRHMEGQP